MKLRYIRGPHHVYRKTGVVEGVALGDTFDCSDAQGKAIQADHPGMFAAVLEDKPPASRPVSKAKRKPRRRG